MKTAVITAGGLGTRLLTFTKTIPKSILPIYDISPDKINEPTMKPLIEFIFERLYDEGFRRFCFIVATRSKSIILDHFITDIDYVKLLQSRNFKADKRFLKLISKNDKKIKNSEIKWIFQDTPAGFGDALLKSKKFVGNNDFLLHAADAYFPNYKFLQKFLQNFEKDKASSSILIQKRKQVCGYGIANFFKNSNEIEFVEEKPNMPKSNFAILPVYIFKPSIFDALQNTSNGYNYELQVTDGIMTLIKNGEKVIGFNYSKNWFDIGTPINYHNAIVFSYNHSKNHSR